MPTVLNSQIIYKANRLNIGGATEINGFNLQIDKYCGLYWTFNNSSNFFQIDISPANPRLAGTGNKIVFYNTLTNTFNNIQVANVYNYSDMRAKTNIKTIESGLSTILNLRPVSYNWINSNSKSQNTDTIVNSRSSTSEISSFGPIDDNKVQYGFLAQEVEEVIPNAVATDENGNKLINYTAIIPLLVQSIQELKGIVNEQQITIDRLSSRMVEANILDNSNIIKSCYPNPTTDQISFEYIISQNVNNVNIIIHNLWGDIEKTILCSNYSSSITEDLSDLRDGIYTATLVVDGITKDSKRIIISN